MTQKEVNLSFTPHHVPQSYQTFKCFICFDTGPAHVQTSVTKVKLRTLPKPPIHAGVTMNKRRQNDMDYWAAFQYIIYTNRMSQRRLSSWQRHPTLFRLWEVRNDMLMCWTAHRILVLNSLWPHTDYMAFKRCLLCRSVPHNQPLW